MSASQIKPTPILHTLTLQVEIPVRFVSDMVNTRDIFSNDQSGYWAYGMRCPDGLGWLIFEQVDGAPQESSIARAKLHWRDHKPLPEGWHLLDDAVAIRAWCEGVKRWGVNWFDQVDGGRRDVVLQLSLLGELRYA